MLFTNLLTKLSPLLPPSRRIFLVGMLGFLPVMTGGVLAAHQFYAASFALTTDPEKGRAVLAADTEKPDFEFNVNVPSNFAKDAIFNKNVTIKGDLNVKGKAVFSEGLSLSGQDIDLGVGTIKASNIVYSLAAGDGIGITSGQTPTITNNGVLSLQSKTGALSLTAGDGITIDGLKISSNVASSDSFKTIAVPGQDSLSAGSSTDTLTFVAGSGISLTTDGTNKKLTITNSASGGGASGVSSLNGGTGTLTLGNATLVGSSLTIDDASMTGKGIASFNSTNFSVSNGAVNLIQNIDLSTTPTFANLTLSGLTVDGGVLYTNSSGDIAQLSAGSSGYVLSSNGSGAAPSWTSLSSLPSVNSWQENAGALSPKNITDSLNLGGVSTASALLHLAGTPGENSFINTGNLGIGSTVPNEALDVNGRIYLGNTSAPSTTTNRLYATSGSLYWNGLQLTTGSGVNGASQWSSNGSDIYYNTGNVGIGSSTPAAKLDVNGGVAINGTQVIDSSRNITNVGQVNTNLTPGTNNTYDLGSASDQWNNIYGQNLYLAGNLVTSGSTENGGSVATFTSSGSAVLRIADNDVFFGGRTTMKTDDNNLANYC